MDNQLKNLPTDNLYKFFALSGVALMISSTWLFVTKAYEAKTQLNIVKDELLFLGNVTQWGVGIGFFMAVTGFILWYFKIQKPMDRDLTAKSELTATQVRLNNTKLDLQIFESIYKEVTKIEENINLCNLYMIGDLAYNLKFDPNKLPKTDISNLKMKVTFYLPELLSNLEEINQTHKSFYNVIANFALSDKTSEQIKQDFIVEGSAFCKAAHLQIEKFKEHLSRTANNKAKEFSNN